MSEVRRQIRVLVVDDDPKASQAIRGLLHKITEFECLPELVSDFDAGVEHFNARNIDVCLLDYGLGGRDGVALLKHAANIGVRFPILFLSDERSVDAVVATMQAGASNYLLRKDLSVETLTRALASALPTERRVNPQRPSDFLTEGDQLFEYRITKVLGHGGFGITYLARDTLLDADVAIKEYLPSDLAFRATHTHVAVRTAGDQDAFQWGLKQFLKEAQTLARFQHPNLVRVRRFFEANATAYFVMEYAHGEPFSAVLKRENTLSEERIRAVLDPLLDALEGVHAAGVLHRDIKPDNILLLADGRPLLIDFGAARVQLGQKTQSLLAMFSAGYTPVEQYSSGTAEQGPWTDIYALGGLAYRCITGHRPDDSVDRVRDDTMAPASQLGKGRYSAGFLEAVDWALNVHATDRPQSVAEWRSGFGGRARFADTSAVTRKSPRTLALGASKAIAWGAAAFVAVLAVGATLKYTLGKPEPPAAVEQAAVTATLPPAQTQAQDDPAPAAKVATKPSGPKAVAAMEAMSSFRDCPNCPEMVVVPPGSFLMGASGKDARPTEQPAHPVVLDKPFAIGRFEVTVGEWAECVRDKACPARNAGLADRVPASRVTWQDAQRYTVWLARRTGRDYRLPSEAAWEYAARSGITTATFWGDKPELQCRYANGNDDADCDDGQARVAFVGRFRPNFYDLYDMLGNVSEWTMDCWQDSYVGAPADGSAMTVGACAKRVARGGGWKSPPDAVRATSREPYDASYLSEDLGFRVAAY